MIIIVDVIENIVGYIKYIVEVTKSLWKYCKYDNIEVMKNIVEKIIGIAEC